MSHIVQSREHESQDGEEFPARSDKIFLHANSIKLMGLKKFQVLFFLFIEDATYFPTYYLQEFLFFGY
jgi:hypothetical protein